MSDETETHQRGGGCGGIKCGEDRAAFGFDSSCLGPVCLLGRPVHPGREAHRYLNETRAQPEAALQSAAASIIRSNCGPLPNGGFKKKSMSVKLAPAVGTRTPSETNLGV